MQGTIGINGYDNGQASRRWIGTIVALILAAIWCVLAKSPAHAAPPSLGDRCVQHDQGRVECRVAETDAVVYSWPVTPDMVGQTLDVSSLTLGAFVFPPLQPITDGQSKVTFEIRGASPGQSVKLVKKLLQAAQEKGASSETCCIEEFEIKIPQAKACVQSVALRPPRPVEADKPIGPAAKVTIEKSCAACPAGGACRCKITVRNVGTGPLTSPVRFSDETRILGGDGDGDTARIEAITTDGDDWSCSGPPRSLRCELPATSLKPVSARSVVVTLEPREPKSGQGARMRNCASLQGDTPGYTIVGDRQSCVELGGDIAVKKSGDVSCRMGEQCSFQVTIANRSKGAYIGPLVLADDLSLGKGSGQKVEIVSIDPPLGCASEPRALPFSCSANVVLPGGKSRTHRIVVRLPKDEGGGGGKDGTAGITGRNCFAAGGPSGDKTAPGETVASLLKTSKASSTASSRGTEARACVEFTALPRCPGDLVLRGSQCVCPGGTERADDDRCRPICGPGERLRGDRCVEDRPTATPLPFVPPPRERPPPSKFIDCPGDLQPFGSYGDQSCGCPLNLVRDGNFCNPPRIGPCPGDLKRYGTPPNVYCGCPEGFIRKGETCSRPVAFPPPPPPPCPGNLQRYGVPPNTTCACPAWLDQKGNQCVTKSSTAPPPPPSCPGDLKPYGTPPVCRCPPDLEQKGTACSKRLTGGTSGTIDPGKPAKCPDGSTAIVGRPCPLTPITCPDGSRVPRGALCPPPKAVTKDCYGRQIPINEACPLRTKTCNGRQIPINEPCLLRMKDCYGRQIPINEACTPPPCPLERVCVQYGKGAPGTFAGPCVRYEMRRQCPARVN